MERWIMIDAMKSDEERPCSGAGRHYDFVAEAHRVRGGGEI